MLNVVFINYCFDVCVKIVSSGLVLMALFLLWQERRRLIDFFFRNRPVVAENEWAPASTGNGSTYPRPYLNTCLLSVLSSVLTGKLSDLKMILVTTG